MKVAVLVFLVTSLAFSVEPIKASPARKHHKNVKSHEEGADSGAGEGQELGFPGASEWPNPGQIDNFNVPQGFMDNNGSYDGGEQQSSQSGKQHHGRSSHKGHRI